MIPLSTSNRWHVRDSSITEDEIKEREQKIKTVKENLDFHGKNGIVTVNRELQPGMRMRWQIVFFHRNFLDPTTLCVTDLINEEWMNRSAAEESAATLSKHLQRPYLPYQTSCVFVNRVQGSRYQIVEATPHLRMGKTPFNRVMGIVGAEDCPSEIVGEFRQKKEAVAAASSYAALKGISFSGILD
jgi:hypothetical protein